MTMEIWKVMCQGRWYYSRGAVLGPKMRGIARRDIGNRHHHKHVGGAKLDIDDRRRAKTRAGAHITLDQRRQRRQRLAGIADDRVESLHRRAAPACGRACHASSALACAARKPKLAA